MARFGARDTAHQRAGPGAGQAMGRSDQVLFGSECAGVELDQRAAERFGHRVNHRRLARAGRADKAQDGAAAVTAHRAHGEVFDDALLGAAQAGDERVEFLGDGFEALRRRAPRGLGRLDRERLPRQVEHPLKPAPRADRVVRVLRDQLQVGELALGRFKSLAGQIGGVHTDREALVLVGGHRSLYRHDERRAKRVRAKWKAAGSEKFSRPGRSIQKRR